MFPAIFLALAIGQPAQRFPSYEAGAAIAVTAGKPLVTFVGITPRAVPGVTVARASGLDELPARCIVVSRPTLYGHEWIETLPVDASDADIRRAAGLEVGRVASPFVLPTAERRQESPVGGDSWPKGFPKPAGLVRYMRATRTQLVFNRTEIQVAERADTERKWQVPGGLDKATGWRSTLYKNVPGPVNEKRGPLVVFNSGFVRYVPSGQIVQDKDGNPVRSTQTETSWQRSYPDGTMFADVLSNERGKVFEVRYSVKDAGEWEHFVAFKDRTARPVGYQPMRSKDCRGCHERAGRGDYNSALNPGGDFVLSDPIEALEKQ